MQNTIIRFFKEHNVEKRYEENECFVRKSLDALSIDIGSDLGCLYLYSCPKLFKCASSKLELDDVVGYDDESLSDFDPWESEVGMSTFFVRDCWELPESMICMTSTEGEGGYIYDTSTGYMYDFDLAQREELCNGTLKPSWKSLLEFLKWYFG